ncbi:carph-isopro domain-containing protein [Acetobacter sp. DsW_063]|uniref:carph-isopro domain-containing protein n=1 Tax=Acetobacter sp. DsW_063 TaxID=1514894 RepID=UPI000A3CF490|nr:YdaS family helix-turn-helix protein [Acetobacter sp. DsW_063]OUJ16506.1 hypothetical protein HK28_12600 [Acetobacter sp. DsW_063]
MSVACSIIDGLGGTRPAAKQFGLPPSTVQSWKKSGFIPVTRILLVEKITGIPREELRPDLFSRTTQETQG